jgi:AcrR family transcriptional regulator
VEDESRGTQTRRAIVAAAIERFGRDGYRATSVTAVARDIGLGPTATYPYFPTKEALFFSAIDDDVAGVVAEAFTSRGGAPHLPEWPAETLQAAFASLDKHPLARRILAGLEPEVASRVLDTPALAEAWSLLAGRLRAGQDAGHVRSDIAVDGLASGLIGLLLAVLAAGVRFGLGHDRANLEAMMQTLHASIVSSVGTR